ncbi:hypothetical protein ACJZ2D_014004 [Fusarium nematophilum]
MAMTLFSALSSLLLAPSRAFVLRLGQGKSGRALFCDDGHLSITVNLDRALRHLRLSNKRRILWADAVCIDQTDLVERARQVQYMRLVYKCAARVIVWLGEKQDWTETAVLFARGFVDLKTDFLDDLDLEADEGQHLGVNQDERSDAYSLLSNMFKNNKAGADAMAKLFGCEYFTRVCWVPRFDQCRIVPKFIPEFCNASVPIKFRMHIAEVYDNHFHPSSPFSKPIEEQDILQLNGFHINTISFITEVFPQGINETFSPAEL